MLLLKKILFSIPKHKVPKLFTLYASAEVLLTFNHNELKKLEISSH